MKLMILAGGFGTRISEESQLKPKPLVEVGGRPIIWHIMKYYSHFGVKDFIICCGYKSLQIKDFFLNYRAYYSDFTVNLGSSVVQLHNPSSEDWSVTLVETGLNTGTAGRILKASKYLGDDTDFFLAYGDTLSDVNVNELSRFHKKHGRWATVTTAIPPGRFGAIKVDGDIVRSFQEKKVDHDGWVSAGFFVINRVALSLISSDTEMWELNPLEKLAKGNQLRAFRHHGFWQPMDTPRDKKMLETLWETKNCPWKVWL